MPKRCVAEPRWILLAGLAAAALTARALADGARANVPNRTMVASPTDQPPAPTPTIEDRLIAKRGSVRSSADGKPSFAGRPSDVAMSMFWPLAIVLASIFVLVWVFRRFQPAGTRHGVAGPLHVLSRQFLSNRQSLLLVRLGRRILLIGLTADRMSTLADVSDPDEAAWLHGQFESGRAGSLTAGFQRILARQQEEFEHDAVEPAAVAGGPAGAQQVRNTVRGLTRQIRAISLGPAAP